jgi:hypothetical protein
MDIDMLPGKTSGEFMQIMAPRKGTIDLDEHLNVLEEKVKGRLKEKRAEMLKILEKMEKGTEAQSLGD